MLKQSVSPWMGSRSLPLWLPTPEYSGFSARDSSAAARAGLLRRPLEATLRDALDWELARAPFPTLRCAGLSDAEEDSLLELLEK
ncbi:MAG: hypothetical protein WCV99_18970 [Sterolibacterium sp.]